MAMESECFIAVAAFIVLSSAMPQPPSQPVYLSDIAVVIPVLNQLSFTKNCLDSLNQAGLADAQIIIVNNGSTDGTREFLSSRPQLQIIHNEVNRGCGHAWTQGARTSTAKWTVVMNNDVLVPPGCLGALRQYGETKQVEVVSPAFVEGDCDYDWRVYATEFVKKMKSVRRTQVAHGVCFMVHRRVFEAIGYFNDDFRFGGYEDHEFFRRVILAGFRLAMTGSAFLHHFGSVTQKSMKSDVYLAKVVERRAYYRELTGQTWLNRKVTSTYANLRDLWWRKTELRRYGLTLKEIRFKGRWEYR
jgi:N-acetylglucosaminyl-diphospho-decaprenol L-rhamnosyltransferase